MILRKLIDIFSYLFHPVLMPTIATGFYFYITRFYYPAQEIFIVSFQVFVTTFLLPIAVYLFLKSTGILQSGIMVKKNGERLLPIFMNIVLIGFLVFFILRPNPNLVLKKFLVAYSLSYIIAFGFVMLKKKVSIHMLSFVAMIPLIFNTALAVNYSPLLILSGLILLTGILASSRLSMRAHTHTQIIQGTIIGLVPQLAIFYLGYFW